MAYNYFPQTYQTPAYYPSQVTNQFPNQAQQQTNNGITWVVGENGADSYLVAPGQTVMLWDSTAPVIYLKSADSLGRPSKKILDYTERNASAQAPIISPESDFVTKEELSSIQKEIDSLKAKFSETKGAKK